MREVVRRLLVLGRGMRETLLALALVTLAASARGQVAPGQAERPPLGIVAQYRDGRWCLSGPDSSLVIGRRLAIAVVPLAGSRESNAPARVAVVRRLSSDSTCVWASYDQFSYEVRVVEGHPSPYPSGPSVALLDSASEFVHSGAELQVRFAPHLPAQTFRSCTSQEGLHLTLWAGRPLRGHRTWHVYHLLGYEVEPSCQPADYAEP